jgi:hypothetical protein
MTTKTKMIVDRKPGYAGDDSLQLEVIGAGLPRTGTSSLWTALEILGYPCYHMIHTIFTEYIPKPLFKKITASNKKCGLTIPTTTTARNILKIGVK